MFKRNKKGKEIQYEAKKIRTALINHISYNFGKILNNDNDKGIDVLNLEP